MPLGALESLREWVRPFYLRNIYFPLFRESKPPGFEDCWRLPPAAPEPAHDGRPVLLFWPMNDWHGRVQRAQHLVRGLSRRGYRCVYLNPHLGREFPARPGRSDQVRLHEVGPRIYELHVHLAREPVFHHRLLRTEEAARLADGVLGVLEALAAPSAVQVLAFPVWFRAAEMVRRRRGAPMLYDCHDYLPGFPSVAREIVDEEGILFRESDEVICSSEALLQRASELGRPETPRLLVRNAASPELLLAVNSGVRWRADPGHVTIGYIGALESWFDVDAVRNAALAHPEWRFEILGRIEDERVRDLRSLPNIHFVGEVLFAQLGAYLRGFSAGMIPFLANELTRATDPIKVYEYFAAGLPVAASKLPELARFGDLLQGYGDSETLARALERALREDSEEKAEARRAVARRETWEARVDVLVGEIERLAAEPKWQKR